MASLELDCTCKDPTPNKATSEVLRSRTSTYLWGDRIQPLSLHGQVLPIRSQSGDCRVWSPGPGSPPRTCGSPTRVVRAVSSLCAPRPPRQSAPWPWLLLPGQVTSQGELKTTPPGPATNTCTVFHFPKHTCADSEPRAPCRCRNMYLCSLITEPLGSNRSEKPRTHCFLSFWTHGFKALERDSLHSFANYVF